MRLSQQVCEPFGKDTQVLILCNATKQAPWAPKSLTKDLYREHDNPGKDRSCFPKDLVTRDVLQLSGGCKEGSSASALEAAPVQPPTAIVLDSVAENFGAGVTKMMVASPGVLRTSNQERLKTLASMSSSGVLVLCSQQTRSSARSAAGETTWVATVLGCPSVSPLVTATETPQVLSAKFSNLVLPSKTVPLAGTTAAYAPTLLPAKPPTGYTGKDLPAFDSYATLESTLWLLDAEKACSAHVVRLPFAVDDAILDQYPDTVSLSPDQFVNASFPVMVHEGPPTYEGPYVLITEMLPLPAQHGWPLGVCCLPSEKVTASSMAGLFEIPNFGPGRASSWLRDIHAQAWFELASQMGSAVAQPTLLGSQLSSSLDVICHQESTRPVSPFRDTRLMVNSRIHFALARAVLPPSVLEPFVKYREAVHGTVFAGLPGGDVWSTMDSLDNPLVHIFFHPDRKPLCDDLGLPFLHHQKDLPKIKQLLPVPLAPYAGVCRPISLSREFLEDPTKQTMLSAPLRTFAEEHEAYLAGANTTPAETEQLLAPPTYDTIRSPPANKRHRTGNADTASNVHWGSNSTMGGGFDPTNGAGPDPRAGSSFIDMTMTSPPRNNNQQPSAETGESPNTKLRNEIAFLRAQVESLKDQGNGTARHTDSRSATRSPGDDAFQGWDTQAKPSGLFSSQSFSSPAPGAGSFGNQSQGGLFGTPSTASTLPIATPSPSTGSNSTIANNPSPDLTSLREMLLDRSNGARVASFFSVQNFVLDGTFSGKFVNSLGEPRGAPINGQNCLRPMPCDRLYYDEVLAPTGKAAERTSLNYLQAHWDDDYRNPALPVWWQPDFPKERIDESVVRFIRSTPQHPRVLTAADLQNETTLAIIWTLTGCLGRDNKFPADGCSSEQAQLFVGGWLWLNMLPIDHSTRQQINLEGLNLHLNSDVHPIILQQMIKLYALLGQPSLRDNWNSSAHNRRSLTIQITEQVIALCRIPFRLYQRARQEPQGPQSVCQLALPFQNGQPQIAMGAQCVMPRVLLLSPTDSATTDIVGACQEWWTTTKESLPTERFGRQYMLPTPSPDLFVGPAPMGPPPSVPQQQQQQHQAPPPGPPMYVPPAHQYQNPPPYHQPYQPPQQQAPGGLPQPPSRQPREPRINKPKAGKPCIVFLDSSPSVEALKKALHERLKFLSTANALPTMQVPAGRSLQVCFGFSTTDASGRLLPTGCPGGRRRGDPCIRLHLDAGRPAEYSREQMQFMHAWFQHPSVAPYFRPTPEFLQCWPVS